MHGGRSSGQAVGEVGLVGPELGGQGLRAGRDEDQGGRELGRRLQEDEAEGGGQARPDEGQGDPPEDDEACGTPSEWPTSSRPMGDRATAARTDTTAMGKNMTA